MTWVKANSALGRQVARAIGISANKLDRMDGSKDGIINLRKLSRNKKNARLRKRIIMAGWGTSNVCAMNAAIVDNGDRKIGSGDIFVLYKKRSTTLPPVHCYARLFKDRKLKSLRRWPCRRFYYERRAKLLIKKIISLKGKRWSSKRVKKLLNCGQ